MTRNISRETAQNSLDKKLDVPKIFYGWLGNNDGVVDVPGRVNYVYVKMTDGMVTQAYNVVVPSILNLPVICGYDQNQLSSGLLKVLSVRNVPRQTPNSTPPASTLVSHHKTHEWMNGDGGQDVTFMELRQFMPLRPSIIEPFTVRIERGVLNLSGVWKYIPTQTIDLTSNVPTTDVYGLSGSAVLGRYSLVSLGAVSGSPAVTSGSLVPITAISLSDVPNTPTGNYPICAVFTYYYQEKLSEARTRTDLIDLRSWTVSTGGTSGSSVSASGSHNDLYGLQGGSSGERYHLTAAQYTIATQASGSGQAGYLSASDWNKFNTASGSQVVPNSHAPVANFYLTGYDKTSGSFSSGSVLSGTSGSGAWYLSDLLDVNIGAQTDGQALVYNAGTDKWIPGSAGTSGSGGISEAPVDGKTYGRKDAGWTEIVSGSGGGGGSHGITVLAVSGSVSSDEGVDRNTQSSSSYAYFGCKIRITSQAVLESMKVDIDISSTYTWEINLSGSTVRSGSFSGSGLDISIAVTPSLSLIQGAYYDFIFTPASNQKVGYKNAGCPVFFESWAMLGIYFGNMSVNASYQFPLRLVTSSYIYELVNI